MSVDVIKRQEFQGLFAPVAADGDGVARFSSAEARLRELEQQLQEARAEHRAALDGAVSQARRAADEQVRAQTAEATAALRAAAARLDELVRAAHETAHGEIVAIATAVAAKILRREIARDDDFAVRLVRRCLEKITARSRVLVRVNAADHRRVLEALSGPAEEGLPAHEFSVVEDRRVERGGCVVETPDFIVDGRMRTQLAAASAALRGEGA
ncbi:MAG: FliH/SctL family protein [Candidatus Eiseniibacteriota bacterium]